MLISSCSSGLFESQEGAGRRLASLPGLRGVPENLFVLFLRTAYGTQEVRKLGQQPQAPGEGLPPFTIPLKLTPKGVFPRFRSTFEMPCAARIVCHTIIASSARN